jgi:hypothetical protein
MVAAVAAAPLPAAKYLCSQFFDSCTTVGSKLHILQVLLTERCVPACVCSVRYAAVCRYSRAYKQIVLLRYALF